VKALKALTSKRPSKQDREKRILFGLVAYYLKTGKPVGSNSLKEAGFEDLSSATIRNYFANLENDGFLTQQHASGGRIPTHKAFRLFAQEHASHPHLSAEDDLKFKALRSEETREIASFLQRAAESLSSYANGAVFLSAPRFDHDFISDVKLTPLDHHRCLCILITDFGVIQTEVIYTEKKLSAFSAKRIEDYFRWRLTNAQKPENLEEEEEFLAKKIYTELMLRFVVGYSNFTDDEIHRTGFSKLVGYTEYQDIQGLANNMALFENAHSMRLLLKECTKQNHLKFWIGEDLLPYAPAPSDCAVIAIPYHINRQAVGAVGILGPARLPYDSLFSLLHAFSDNISEALTRNLFKFKINYRQPNETPLYLQKEEHLLLGRSRLLLIEDKSNEEMHVKH
jgi:heat-inducible transcriptional repressor